MTTLRERDFESKVQFDLLSESQTEVAYKHKMGFIYYTAAMLLIAATNFHVKYTNYLYPEAFDSFSFNFWRTTIFIPIGYYMVHKQNEQIVNFFEIKEKFWFIARVSCNFIALMSFIGAMKYFRVATIQSISSMNPVLVLILSVVILKEKFYPRYLVALIACLIGTLIIILNDRKYINKDTALSADDEQLNPIFRMLFGVMFSLISMVSVALLVVSAKILINENITSNNQIFYIGISSVFFSVCSFFFTQRVNCEFSFILTCFFNGILYIAFIIYNVKALELIDVSKVSALAYVCTLAMFVLGVIFLGEPIFFTDIVGSLLILSVNIYNSLYPVDKI